MTQLGLIIQAVIYHQQISDMYQQSDFSQRYPLQGVIVNHPFNAFTACDPVHLFFSYKLISYERLCPKFAECQKK